jgi:hypothetical protein
MSPVLVIRIGDYDGGGGVSHHRLSRFPVTLGRGFANDIILPDPHSSARHAEIAHDGTDWILSDLGSDNGILVNGMPLENGHRQLKSGDTFMIGRTPVSVFDPHHPVPAAEKLEHAHPFISHISGSLVPWLYFTLAVAAISLMDYIAFWSENTAAQAAKTAGGAGLAILLWALPWSVAGRLIRHRSGFRAHVALVSLCLLAATFLWPLQDLLNFLTSENLFSLVCEYMVNGALISVLVYGSLAVATHMTVRHRALAAGFFTAGLMSVIIGLSYISSGSFTPHPQYAAGLEPYFHNLPRADSLDDFLSRAARITGANAAAAD